MKILCKMFGHRPAGTGWWGDISYMKLRYHALDNVGTVHGKAYHECKRCGEEYLVGRLHFTDKVIIRSLTQARPELMAPASGATILDEPEKTPRRTFIIIGFVILFMIALAVFHSAKSADFEPLTRDEPIVRMVLQEAAGEGMAGQVAVAGVALDRMSDDRWPDTATAVIYQPWQFTGMRAKIKAYSQSAIEKARAAVKLARTGFRPCGRVLWYHTPWVSPSWSGRYKRKCWIGGHIFYGDNDGN